MFNEESNFKSFLDLDEGVKKGTGLDGKFRKLIGGHSPELKEYLNDLCGESSQQIAEKSRKVKNEQIEFNESGAAFLPRSKSISNSQFSMSLIKKESALNIPQNDPINKKEENVDNKYKGARPFKLEKIEKSISKDDANDNSFQDMTTTSKHHNIKTENNKPVFKKEEKRVFKIQKSLSSFKKEETEPITESNYQSISTIKDYSLPENEDVFINEEDVPIQDNIDYEEIIEQEQPSEHSIEPIVKKEEKAIENNPKSTAGKSEASELQSFINTAPFTSSQPNPFLAPKSISKGYEVVKAIPEQIPVEPKTKRKKKISVSQPIPKSKPIPITKTQKKNKTKIKVSKSRAMVDRYQQNINSRGLELICTVNTDERLIGGKYLRRQRRPPMEDYYGEMIYPSNPLNHKTVQFRHISPSKNISLSGGNVKILDVFSGSLIEMRPTHIEFKIVLKPNSEYEFYCTTKVVFIEPEKDLHFYMESQRAYKPRAPKHDKVSYRAGEKGKLINKKEIELVVKLNYHVV